MDGRLNAGLLAVGLLLVGCYMSHSAAADDDFSGDAIVDAHRSEDAGDRSILDGRYPQEDAWDLVACSDAACPDGMARIPCGPFVWGSRPGTGRTPAEEPAGVVWMPTYCIDQTETTVSQYFDCVASGVCAGIDLECNPDPWSSNPVRCVDSSQARRYCIWRGRFLSGSFRLASGGQWEKAARGGCEIVPPDDCGPEDERLYPWGDAPPTCDLANAAGCAGEVLPVG
ncbi:MAG: formylglycine-generating enzyme family protein, partial [Myxococcales bacterium]|nr:formylglycine-generating enzyme family protein [Myxococcales bacterium]